LTVELYHGDCLDIMPTLPDHSFDAIIADLPYGTTACKWDSVIPFEKLWEQYKRLIKKRGAIVLFGSQPFTSALVMSNVGWFKYCWYWDKVRGSNFATINIRPFNSCEDVAVFYQYQPTYNPQMRNGKPYTQKQGYVGTSKQTGLRRQNVITKNDGTRHPLSILRFSKETGFHPTQKPVALLEYLIRTYTNPGDTVLDNTMGSGTTMVACVNTGRDGDGIELYPLPGKPIHKTDNPDYFGIAQGRVEKAQNEMVQLGFEEKYGIDRS